MYCEDIALASERFHHARPWIITGLHFPLLLAVQNSPFSSKTVKNSPIYKHTPYMFSLNPSPLISTTPWLFPTSPSSICTRWSPSKYRQLCVWMYRYQTGRCNIHIHQHMVQNWTPNPTDFCADLFVEAEHCRRLNGKPERSFKFRYILFILFYVIALMFQQQSF